MKHVCLETGSCRFFEIGLGRTGTRSVCSAMRILGFKAVHGFNGCEACEADAVEKFLEGRSDFQLYRTADYSGNVSSFHWRKLLRIERAKFILTLRPIDEWLDSVMRIDTKRLVKLLLEGPARFTHLHLLHHFGQITFRRERWRRGYLEHVEAIRSTIPSGRLLEVDVFQESSEELWRRLVEFVGLSDVPEGSFPRETKKLEWV